MDLRRFGRAVARDRRIVILAPRPPPYQRRKRLDEQRDGMKKQKCAITVRYYDEGLDSVSAHWRGGIGRCVGGCAVP